MRAGLLGGLGLVWLICACGLGGDTSGGGSQNLPVSGAGPYRKLTDFELQTPIEEPYVLSELGVNLADPSPLRRPGGALRLFYTRNGTEIWRADLPALTQPFADATVALVAADAWEQGAVRAPSVIEHAGQLLLFYEGGAGGIGRAESSDGGATWTRTGMVVPGGASPSAVVLDGTFHVYFARDRHIFVATSTDGRTFAELPDPVLAPRAGSFAGSFDGRSVGEPHAAGGITEAGALHVALFYTGVDTTGLAAIGYAGSDDGTTFIARRDPILDDQAPSERAASVLLSPSSAILFFTQDRTGRTAIAAATSP